MKKVPAKELTKPVGFDLETNKRNEVWASHKQEDEEPEPFHARPVPSAIFKGPTVSKLFHVAPEIHRLLIYIACQYEPVHERPVPKSCFGLKVTWKYYMLYILLFKVSNCLVFLFERSFFSYSYVAFHFVPVLIRFIKYVVNRCAMFLQGIKPAKEIAVTVPESPAFALRSRVRPQRKPSLPQVKFLPSATKLRRLCFYRRPSVHGGGVCLSTGWDTTPHPGADTPLPGADIAPERRPLLRTVRILLECIKSIVINSHMTSPRKRALF